jgi:hypothetical protein
MSENEQEQTPPSTGEEQVGSQPAQEGTKSPEGGGDADNTGDNPGAGTAGTTSAGAPAGNESVPSGNTSAGADLSGDAAQQDTGALQE